MSTKTAIMLPEPYWLIERPNAQVIGREDFFKELASWDSAIGLRISALRGALLVFDFEGYPEAEIQPQEASVVRFDELVLATQARVRLINAFSLCLHSAGITEGSWSIDCFRVNHTDLIHIVDDNFSVNGIAALKLPRLLGMGYVVNVRRHLEIQRAVVATACETLNYVVQHEFGKALELVVLTNDALASYKAHDFSSALVTAWTVCEVLLEHNWKSYIQGSSTSSVSATRFKKLTGRDFTASIITEVLYLAQVIDSDLLDLLEVARKGRNAWIHSIKAPSREKAADSLNAATRMLQKTLGLNLWLDLSIEAMGF